MIKIKKKNGQKSITPRQSSTLYYQISSKGNPTQPNSLYLPVRSESHFRWDPTLFSISRQWPPPFSLICHADSLYPWIPCVKHEWHWLPLAAWNNGDQASVSLNLTLVHHMKWVQKWMYIYNNYQMATITWWVPTSEEMCWVTGKCWIEKTIHP